MAIVNIVIIQYKDMDKVKKLTTLFISQVGRLQDKQQKERVQLSPSKISSKYSKRSG